MVNKSKRKYQISGSVIDRKTGRAIEKLKIEAWDKDLICDDLVGSAVSNQQGAFQIEFDESYFRELFHDRQPDLFFKVFSEGALIKSTEDSVLWNINAGAIEIIIEVDVPAPEELILVNSIDDLNSQEKQILSRIHANPNGGFLFLAHPFLLLEEVGVKLASNVREQLISRMPELGALSTLIYDALRSHSEDFPVQVELKGLFPQGSSQRRH